jgi:hypothetical protein
MTILPKSGQFGFTSGLVRGARYSAPGIGDAVNSLTTAASESVITNLFQAAIALAKSPKRAPRIRAGSALGRPRFQGSTPMGEKKAKPSKPGEKTTKK